MNNLDLNMLRVLDEVYQTRSLSRTANRLGLSQPGVSMALARLREHFEDPLFVRVGHEMRPTAQAEGMREGVIAAIAALESTLTYRFRFDPFTTERVFRVAMSDIGQIVMGPRLLETFWQLAPQAGVEFVAITDRTPELLETGLIDLAVGPVPNVPEGFFQQAVFKEEFVCLASLEHPRIVRGITIDQFREEGHVVVISSSYTHVAIERALEERRIRRRVAVRLPNFLLMPKLVATTQHIAMLPRRAGLTMATETPGLAAYPPPIKLPGHTITQYWHKRQSQDPGNRWLRDLFVDLFGDR
ncbi:LysR family transcriptional regulator [Achromobacter denitrificans]